MEIKDIKKGDIITRINPTSCGDESFIGLRLRYLGNEGKCIFVRKLNPSFTRDKIRILAGEKWFDSSWELFPEELYQSLRKENKDRIERLNSIKNSSEKVEETNEDSEE